MASKLINRKTGKSKFFSDAETTDLVKAGEWALPAGITIPVVGSDGGAYDLPSEDAEAAFKRGDFRWQTQSDKDLRTQEAKDANVQEHSPGVIQSAVLGGIRGAVPLADPMMIALGGAMGGSEGASATKEQLNLGKELHPTASAVGTVAGALLSPINTAIGKGITTATEGALAANAASKVMGASTAPATTIVQRAIGAGTEGAFWGLNDKISEAALGHPEDVAENIFSGVAGGALFGAGLGAATGLAAKGAPLAKKIFHWSTDKAEELGYAAAQKAGETTLKAVASAEEVAQFNALTQAVDPAVRPGLEELFHNGGIREVEKAIKSVDREVGAARRDLEYAQRNLDRDLKSYPKRIAESVKGELSDFKGNVDETLGNMNKRYQGAASALDGELAQDVGPAHIADDLFGELDRLSGLPGRSKSSLLHGSGDGPARAFASELRDLSASQLASKGITPQMIQEGDVAFNAAFNGGQEVRFGRDVVRRIDETLAKNLAPDVRKTLESSRDRIDDMLRSHPVHGERISTLDDTYESMEALRAFSNKSKFKVRGRVIEPKDLTAKQQVLHDLVHNPLKSQELDAVLGSFSDVVPLADAMKKSGKSIAEMDAARGALTSKIRELVGNNYSGQLTADDALHIVETFKLPRDIASRADQVKRLQEQFQTLQTGTASDKLLALETHFGRSIAPELKSLLKYEKQFEGLAKIAPNNVNADFVSRIMRTGARGIAKRTVAGAVGMGVGSLLGPAVGSTMGAIAGMAAGGAASGLMNPFIMTKNMARISSLSSTAKNQLNKAFDATVHSFIESTKGTSKLTNIFTQTYGEGLPERRKSFKERAAILTARKASPQVMADAVEERIGSLEGAPQISAAMGTQFVRNSTFLADKLPKDPLAQFQLFANKSPWEPSDFELGKYERFEGAVENPGAVVENIASGKASPEEIEALKVCYPRTYARLQEQVMDAIIAGDHQLSYEKRIMLGTLLQVPTDMTLRPQFVSAMQANWQTKGQGSSGSATPSAPSSKKLDLDLESRASPTSRITNK